MPTFNDSENIPQFQPEGDYQFCVIEFECGISNGSKTAGSDKYELTVEIEGKGNKVFETLTDHPSCNWKIDTFLKCCGVTLKKGEAFEFRKDIAEQKGIRWINPLGLRGIARFYVDEYQGKKRNKISTFYTDKQKLPVRVIEEDDIPFS